MRLMFNTKSEEDFLFSNLNKDMSVLEWGSGGSTIAIANRVKEMYSIEHSPVWYEKVKSRLPENVNYSLVRRNKEEVNDGTYEDYKDYIEIAKTFNKKFDLIFIDGRARVECAKVAVNLLNEGGVILLHDIFNPDPKCDRIEYYEVLNFLNKINGEYSLYKFTPKMQTPSMCWDNQYCVEQMNAFYDKHLKTRELTSHLKYFSELLNLTEGKRILDLGCGTGILSEFCKGFDYTGADMRHIVEGSSKRNYPDNNFKNIDVVKEDLRWIEHYDVVVVNAVIDVMQNPLWVLDKILRSTKKYLIIHRQEITERGETEIIVNDSYGGKTYHSIIKRSDFFNVVEMAGFGIYKEINLDFANWENNGNSFLLRRL